jgi:signal transduction histidine kinase/ActR/RegA family two-component response regulator
MKNRRTEVLFLFLAAAAFIIVPIEVHAATASELLYRHRWFIAPILIFLTSIISWAIYKSKAAKRAEEANRMKNEFISRISHDIRTPLSGVISMTEFAKQDIDDPVKLKRDLAGIENSGKYLLSLINDVLDISNMENDTISLNPEPLSFEEFREATEEFFRKDAEDNGLNIDFRYEGDNITVEVDPVRLKQIALNITSNAIRYSRANGHIDFECGNKKIDENTSEIYLKVSDNGIGMSEEFKKHLFEPFQQDVYNMERRRISGGTGLGMSITKRIVDMMNGSIKVDTELGKGTKVEVRLQLPRIEDGTRIEIRSRSAIVEASLSGKLLLAEDNEINREIAGRMLSHWGFDVEYAEDGLEALEKFKLSDPGEYGAILMDIQMPVLNGYDSTLKIRALDRRDSKSIPIIAMTADAFYDVVQKAHDVGMNDFITKPISPAELLEALKKAMKI